MAACWWIKGGGGGFFWRVEYGKVKRRSRGVEWWWRCSYLGGGVAIWVAVVFGWWPAAAQEKKRDLR